MAFTDPNELMLDICKYISSTILKVYEDNDILDIVESNPLLFDYNKYGITYEPSKDLLVINYHIVISKYYKDHIILSINDYFSNKLLHGKNNDYYFYILLREILDSPRFSPDDGISFNFSYVDGKSSYFDLINQDITVMILKNVDNYELYLMLNSTYNLRQNITSSNFWRMLLRQSYPLVYDYTALYLYKFNIDITKAIVLTLNKIRSKYPNKDKEIFDMIFNYYKVDLTKELYDIRNYIRSTILYDFSDIINMWKFYSNYYKRFIEPNEFNGKATDIGILIDILPPVRGFEELYRYINNKKYETPLHNKIKKFILTGSLEMLTYEDKHTDEYLGKLKESTPMQLDSLWSNLLKDPQFRVVSLEDITPLLIILMNKLRSPEYIKQFGDIINKIISLGLTEYYNDLLRKIYGQYYYEIMRILSLR